MKRLVFIPIALLLLSSCELLKNATEIEFEGVFKLGYLIELDENDNLIHEEEIVSLEDDEDVKEYKDNLEDIEVDSIVISITEYSGPVSELLNGSLSFCKVTESTGTAFSSITNVDIADLYTTGRTVKLTYNESEIPNLTEILLEDESVKIYLDGTASNVPVTFRFNVKFYTNITAQALK